MADESPRVPTPGAESGRYAGSSPAPLPAPRDEPPVGRILWNRRPDRAGGDAKGDIDEIVLHDVATVHVEQMDRRCWWIGIDLADGGYWSGNFTCDSRGRMRFWEQEPPDGFEWDRDDTHELTDDA